MTTIEGQCTHDEKIVRVTDARDFFKAKANIYTCRRSCCIHEAFHTVHDVTGVEHPLIVPLPPC